MEEEGDLDSFDCALLAEPEELGDDVFQGPPGVFLTYEVVAADEMRILELLPVSS